MQGWLANASIGTYVRRLDGAQQRGFAKWPIFGVPLMQYCSFATLMRKSRSSAGS